MEGTGKVDAHVVEGRRTACDLDRDALCGTPDVDECDGGVDTLDAQGVGQGRAIAQLDPGTRRPKLDHVLRAISPRSSMALSMTTCSR